VACDAGVIVLAALHLDGDDVGWPVIVQAAAAGIEVDPEHLRLER
jgi:hypothetical protein